jgi:transposase
VDCHPDTFTAAVLEGDTPHNAKHLLTKGDMTLEEFLTWASQNFTSKDLFLMEAGGNSFEIHRRLSAMNLRAVVMESAFVGRQAKNYADNDAIASKRIAMVFLGTKAPCVWVPDLKTIERRELLHAYNNAVTEDTRASNSLKGYLNQHAVRLQKRNPKLSKTRDWVLESKEWDSVQRAVILDLFDHVSYAAQRRKKLTALICEEITKEPLMLSLMSLLGIGKINAFALIAIIGDIKRFENPRKLVAYLGLNPGQRDSGTKKRIKVGVGRRGRKDMRNLLIQASHYLLRKGKATTLGQWGMKLLLRKGHRNIAVAAVARKLSTQVWHLLSGNIPDLFEDSKTRNNKLKTLLVEIGKARRAELDLGLNIADCLEVLNQKITLQKQILLNKN